MGPFELHWAGFALGLGFLVGTAVGRRHAHRQGISPSTWWAVATVTMVVVMIGARVGYVVLNWSSFANPPLDWWNPPIQGLSYFGGLIAGIGWLAGLARRRGQSFWSLADLFALPYVAGLLVAVLIWRSPLAWAGLPAWITLIADLAYVSGMYAVLWVVGFKQRQSSFAGELFLIAILGDALARLILGSLTSVALPAGWWSAWGMHLAHSVTFVISWGFYRMRAGHWGIVVREKVNVADQRPPLSRWAGWLAVYGFIVSVHVVFRTVAH